MADENHYGLDNTLASLGKAANESELRRADAEVGALRARVAELEAARLRSFCVYCQTYLEADTPEALVDMILDHGLACEHRPEARLLDALDHVRRMAGEQWRRAVELKAKVERLREQQRGAIDEVTSLREAIQDLGQEAGCKEHEPLDTLRTLVDVACDRDGAYERLDEADKALEAAQADAAALREAVAKTRAEITVAEVSRGAPDTGMVSPQTWQMGSEALQSGAGSALVERLRGAEAERDEIVEALDAALMRALGGHPGLDPCSLPDELADECERLDDEVQEAEHQRDHARRMAGEQWARAVDAEDESLRLLSICREAAKEFDEHWDALCDEHGGPVHLRLRLHGLLGGGYTSPGARRALGRLRADRDALRAEVERLRGALELIERKTRAPHRPEPWPASVWADAYGALYPDSVSLLLAEPCAEGEDRYLIWDTRGTSPPGWNALFWGPNGSGYTTRLDKAGRYTRAEAEEQQRNRDTDRAVPAHIAQRIAFPCVDEGMLRATLRDEAKGEGEGEGKAPAEPPDQGRGGEYEQ